MRVSLAVTLVATLLAAFSLGCERRNRPIRVGAIASLSGDHTSFGVSNRQGYQLAVEECNGKGGLLGKQVQLILADDRGDPKEGAAQFAKVIGQDKVAAILGATLSRVTLAGAPLAQAGSVPLISPAATSPRVTASGDCVFRVCYTDRFQGQAGASFAFRELRARRAACVYNLDDEYGSTLGDAFSAAFRELGGQVPSQEGHPAGTADFRPQLNRALLMKPDLIYLASTYPEAALIARQARVLGFRGTLLGGDGWDSPELLRMAGSVLSPAYYTCHFAKDDPQPEAQEFVRRYRARFGTDPDSHAATAYDAAQVLIDAIRRAGTTESQALRLALAASRWQGVSGLIQFDAHRNPAKSASVQEISGDRVQLRTRIDS